MKKTIVKLLCVSLLAGGFASMISGCSEKKALFLNVPVSVEANADGKAEIKGKTLPNADVKIGMGIIGDSTEADGKGNFTLKYKLVDDDAETIKVTTKADDDKKIKEIKIKPNAAKIASEKAAALSSERASKASESSSNASSQADQSKIDSVADKYTTAYQVKFQDYTIIYLINENTKTIVMTTSDDTQHLSKSQYTGNFNDGIDFNMDGLAMHAHYRYVDQPTALIINDESGNENKGLQTDPEIAVQYFHIY